MTSSRAALGHRHLTSSELVLSAGLLALGVEGCAWNNRGSVREFEGTTCPAGWSLAYVDERFDDEKRRTVAICRKDTTV